MELGSEISCRLELAWSKFNDPLDLKQEVSISIHQKNGPFVFNYTYYNKIKVKLMIK